MPEATTADHLWYAMRSKMIELNFKSDFHIKNVIDSWIMQRCSFMLKMTRNSNSNSKDLLTISVEFYNKLDERQIYYIPLTYTTELNLNFTITWTNIWLTPLHSTVHIHLEKNQWIIFNLQQAGKY